MSDKAVTIYPRLEINVFDPQGLYETAMAAYMQMGSSREEAESYLGTPTEPNLTRCLVEIWAEHSPAESGYEFVDFD